MGCCDSKPQKEQEIIVEDKPKVDNKQLQKQRLSELYKSKANQKNTQQTAQTQVQRQDANQTTQISTTTKNSLHSVSIAAENNQVTQQSKVQEKDKQADAKQQAQSRQNQFNVQNQQSHSQSIQKENYKAANRLENLVQQPVKQQEIKQSSGKNIIVFSNENGRVEKIEEQAFNVAQLKYIVERIVTRKQFESQEQIFQDSTQKLKSSNLSQDKQKSKH